MSAPRFNRSITHAWIMWSQEASPLFDETKASRLWNRSSSTVISGLIQMGLKGLIPANVEVTR